MNKNNFFYRSESLLFKPVDAASLCVFRVLFGLLLGYFAYEQLSSGSVISKYLQTNYHFTFGLFDFLGLKPLNPGWMLALFKIMGLSACCIALGIFYRIFLITFFCTFGYMLLLDKTYFNNHYYLILLLTFLFFFVGANRWASIECLRDPDSSRRMIPYWHVLLFRAQICIVYFFAGITKISKDYLDGRHMRLWLKDENLLPFLQPWISTDFAINLFIFASIFIDLGIAFFLCYRKTRPLAFIIAILFHMTNKLLFDIGIFHYFMIATLILFVDPDEPRLLWHRCLQLFRRDKMEPPGPEYTHPTAFKRKIAYVFVGIYLLIQLLVPLRHLLYEGDVNWTREGHRFSWRLKANISGGQISINVVDPKTNETHLPFPFEDMNANQFYIMSYTPDMILQYAQFLQRRYQKMGIENPIVKVDGKLSLNGRPYLPYVNRDVNIADKSYKLFQSADWLLPMAEGL